MANIDMGLVMDRINSYRNRHGAPPLQWTPDLQNESQAWANHIASTGVQEHGGKGNHGQNLFWFSDQQNDNTSIVLRSIDGWYDEIKVYNYSNPGYDPKTGHFTQLVWKNTRTFGVGVARSSHGTFVAMNFDPSGNYEDQFRENVLPPGSEPVPPSGPSGGSGSAHVLLTNQKLNQGEALTSPNGKYRAIMQEDGNFVLYSDSQPLWASQTLHQGTPPYELDMQPDGNLVLYDQGRRATWSSQTCNVGSAPFQLVLQDDRNLVLYDNNRKATWSTGTFI